MKNCCRHCGTKLRSPHKKGVGTCCDKRGLKVAGPQDRMDKRKTTFEDIQSRVADEFEDRGGMA